MISLVEKLPAFFCELCHKHRDRLRAIRNFNSAFIDGVTGSALKKDNVVKHKKSHMHSKAVNMERKTAKTIHFCEEKNTQYKLLHNV